MDRWFQNFFQGDRAMPRDEGSEERIALLDHQDGAWGCQTHWCCTRVCPKKIHVTKEISQDKRRIYEAKHPKK